MPTVRILCSLLAGCFLPLAASAAPQNEPGPDANNAARISTASLSRTYAPLNPIGRTLPFRAIGKLYGFSGVLDIDGFIECMGTLIGPSLVLTSADCGQQFQASGFEGAFYPAYSGYGPGLLSERWAITDIRIAPNYSRTYECAQYGECLNDIAIVRLETKSDRLSRLYRLGEKIGWLPVGLDGARLSDSDAESPTVVTRLHDHLYYASDPDAARLWRLDTPVEYDATRKLLVGPSPELIDRQTASGDQPNTTGVSWGGGPWILNFGEGPVAREGNRISIGVDTQRNQVIAVSQTLYGTGEAYASTLTQENFGVIYDAFCAEDARNCNWTPPESKENPAIRLQLEEPVAGGVYSGVGNLRGWALYEFPIETIDVYIDGELTSQVPFGGERPDVEAAFPEYYGARASGFSAAFGYGDLAPGSHTIRVVATAMTGEFTESSATFEVQRFHKPFIDAQAGVSTEQAQLTAAGDGVLMEGVSIDGRSFDVKLEWDTASQSFSITEIKQR